MVNVMPETQLIEECIQTVFELKAEIPSLSPGPVPFLGELFSSSKT